MVWRQTYLAFAFCPIIHDGACHNVQNKRQGWLWALSRPSQTFQMTTFRQNTASTDPPAQHWAPAPFVALPLPLPQAGKVQKAKPKNDRRQPEPRCLSSKRVRPHQKSKTTHTVADKDPKETNLFSHLGASKPKQGSLHYTPEHCLVNGVFHLFGVAKSHVSNGCKNCVF